MTNLRIEVKHRDGSTHADQVFQLTKAYRMFKKAVERDGILREAKERMSHQSKRQKKGTSKR